MAQNQHNETTQSSSTNATTEETPVTGEATTTTTNQANTPATTQSKQYKCGGIESESNKVMKRPNDTNTVSSVNYLKILQMRKMFQQRKILLLKQHLQTMNQLHRVQMQVIKM